MVLRERIELSTSPLPRECSTTELPQLAMAGLLPYWTGKRKASVEVCLNWLADMPAPYFSLSMTRLPGRWKIGMKGSKEQQGKSADDRKARLAEALRTNLMKRKAQSRSRRAGAADARPDGLVGSRERKED